MEYSQEYEIMHRHQQVPNVTYCYYYQLTQNYKPAISTSAQEINSISHVQHYKGSRQENSDGRFDARQNVKTEGSWQQGQPA